VTDVLLTHAHYDHALNWVLFPNATIHIGRVEMDWAVQFEPGDHLIPELYIQALKVSRQLSIIEDGADFLPGFRAVRCAGHTPGCLVFLLTGAERNVLFTGDAAKNRAELLCRRADMTMDEAATSASMESIWQLWQSRPGTLLIPGHDTPMVLEEGQPRFVGTREAGIRTWYDDTIEKTTLFDFVADAG
jgi:N-acyl homoserine lactone hydrolase